MQCSKIIFILISYEILRQKFVNKVCIQNQLHEAERMAGRSLVVRLLNNATIYIKQPLYEVSYLDTQIALAHERKLLKCSGKSN